MDKGKEMVLSSTKVVGQILKLVKEALKTKNYLEAEEFKKATELAKSCKEVDRICIFKPHWVNDNSSAVGLFHKKEIAKSYAKKYSLFKIIETKSPK